MRKILNIVALLGILVSQSQALICVQDEAVDWKIRRHCSERSFGATYTNNTSDDKYVFVVAVAQGYQPNLKMIATDKAGKTIPPPRMGYYATGVSALIPPGGTYSVTSPGIVSSWSWYEK